MLERTLAERKAVLNVATIITDMGWFFRELSVLDFGIDGHIEIIKNGKPTGRLIGVQIKGGNSYFSLEESHTVPNTYYVSNTHYYYWLNSSIPIKYEIS